MSEKISRGGPRIRYDGVFNWEEMYLLFYKWLKSRKYDFYETKNTKKTGTWGFEREYGCHAEREETGYVRHDIDINIHAHHVEDIEIIEGGEKKQVNRVGMVIIDITPSVILDWQDRWDKGGLKKARSFFHKYLLEGYAREQLDKVYYDAYKLHTKLKEFFDLASKYSAY